MADPMAAVYANVNQNLSTTGASLLTPWGMPPGQQVHACESQEPTSPTAASDLSDYPTSAPLSFHCWFMSTFQQAAVLMATNFEVETDKS